MSTEGMKNDYVLQLMKDSGDFFVDCCGRVWTNRNKSHGKIENYWRRAETVPAGSGRYQVRLNGKLVYASRLVWFWFNGEIGKHEIDHIDNNKLNNHPRNLQKLTRLENQRKAEKDGLCAKARYPSDKRKAATKKWWSNPEVRTKMKEAQKQSWKTRKEQQNDQHIS